MKPVAAYSLAFMLATTHGVLAGEPWTRPGDMRVRSDLELLVDEGVINLPMSEWPIAVSDLAAALDEVQNRLALQPSSGKPGESADHPSADPAGAGAHRVREGALTRAQSMAFERLRRLASQGHPTLGLDVRAAVHPTTLRTFADDPRAGGELSGYAAGFFGDRFGGRLQVTAVANEAEPRHPTGEDTTLRLDGSYVAGIFGNWIVTAGAQDRWWGSGWDASLILSNNVRPVPALALDRAVSDPFKTKWLSWLGPWRLTTFMGYMEAPRNDYNHPLLWGLRVSARPAKGLEIGLERTAIWCGEGRACNLSQFWKVISGNDFTSGGKPNPNEPGDQLGGFDIRWASPITNAPYAIYWQHTGETFRSSGVPRPYRNLDLYGVEIWGATATDGSYWRAGLEVANTRCDGSTNGKPNWDCAYEHHIYTDGYRYYGRPIGDSMDGDGESYGLRFVRVGSGASVLNGLLRYSMLNRGGVVPAPHNSIAPGPEDWWSVDATYRHPLGSGWVEAGAGGDYRDRMWNGTTAVLLRVSLTWHHEFQ